MKEYELYDTYNMFSDENLKEAKDNIVENMFWSSDTIKLIDNFGKEVELTREEYAASLKEETIWNEVVSWHDTWFSDLLHNMDAVDKDCNGIIAVGKIGRWNGTVSGYKECNSLKDAMYCSGDDMRVYVDRYGNLCKEWSDHDGSSSCIIRQWKNGISDVQKDNFLDKVYHGKATAKDISRYTASVGKLVKDYYGF